MNDIEAMKRYLDALAASKRQHQQQQQQAHAMLAHAMASHAAAQQQQQQQQRLPPHARSDNAETRPVSAAAVPSIRMDLPIPTKLNNLRMSPPLDRASTSNSISSSTTALAKNALPSIKAPPPVLRQQNHIVHDYDDSDDGDEQEHDEDDSCDSNDPSASSTAVAYAYIQKNLLPQGSSSDSTSMTTTTATIPGLILPKIKKNRHSGASSAAIGRTGESVLVTQGPLPTRLVYWNVADTAKALLLPPVDRASRVDREERSHRMLARLQESGVLTTRDTTPGQLPITFQPGLHDVIIVAPSEGGRGSKQQHNANNNINMNNTEFQQLIFCSVPTYQVSMECHCPQDIKKLVQTIVQTVSHQIGGRFVAPIQTGKTASSIPPLWCEVSRNIAERFCLHELKMASQAMNKVQQSMMERSSLPMRAETARATTAGILKKAPPRPSSVSAHPTTHTMQQEQQQVLQQYAPPSTLQYHTFLPNATAAAPASTPFARRVSPPDMSPPRMAELLLGGGGKTSPSMLDPLALLSEAACRVDSAAFRYQHHQQQQPNATRASRPDSDDDDDDERSQKRQRISVNA